VENLKDNYMRAGQNKSGCVLLNEGFDVSMAAANKGML